MGDFTPLSGRSNVIRIGGTAHIIDLDAARLRHRTELTRLRRESRSVRRAGRPARPDRPVPIPAVPARDGPDAA